MKARDKKTLTVLALGSVILSWRLYVLYVEYSPSAAKAGPAMEPVAQPPVPEQGSADQDGLAEVWEAQERIAAAPWTERQPFDLVQWAGRNVSHSAAPVTKHPAPEPPPTPDCNLTGVSKSGSRWLAVVNGRLVEEGDILQQEYRVVRIGSKTITFAASGWEFTFTLGAQGVEVRAPMEEK